MSCFHQSGTVVRAAAAASSVVGIWYQSLKKDVTVECILQMVNYMSLLGTVKNLEVTMSLGLGVKELYYFS